MTVDRSKAIRSLCKKGFHKDESGDHIYFYHEFGGRETGAWTKISHTKKKKDIGWDLLLNMRKQLRLDTNREAADLLSCPMDGDAFNAIMKEKEIF